MLGHQQSGPVGPCSHRSVKEGKGRANHLRGHRPLHRVPDCGFLGEAINLKPVSGFPSLACVHPQASPRPKHACWAQTSSVASATLSPQSNVLRSLHTRSLGPDLQLTLPGCPGQDLSPSEIAPQASSTNCYCTTFGIFGGGPLICSPSQSRTLRRSWGDTRGHLEWLLAGGGAGDVREGRWVSGAEVWPPARLCVLMVPWRLLCNAPHTWCVLFSAIWGTSFDLSPRVRSRVSPRVEFGRGLQLYRSVCVRVMRPQETQWH